jgi:hypothetical protein
MRWALSSPGYRRRLFATKSTIQIDDQRRLNVRKIVLRFTFVLLGVFALGLVVQALPFQASPHQGGRNSLAFYYPEDTLFFAELRIDDTHLDQLDTLYRNIITTAPDFQGPSSLRDGLDEIVQPGVTIGDLYEAFGDYVAVGVQLDIETFIPTYKIVADITDREFVESLIEEGFESSPEEVDGNTVYEDFGTTYIVTDNKLIVNLSDTGDDTVAPEGASLLDNANWQSAWETAPEDAYNISIFADLPQILQNQEMRRSFEDNAMMNDLLDTVGAVLIGMTIIDDYSLVIDTVQLAGEQPQMFQLAEVDPEFVRYIPANMSAFMQYSDLTGIVHQSLTLLDDFYAMYKEQVNSPNNPMFDSDAQLSELLRAGLRVTGFDLDEDILSWTTGDFAFFGRSDILPVVEFMAKNFGSRPASEDIQTTLDDFDFGGVFEIGDVEQAQAFNEEISDRVLALDTLVDATERSNNVDVEQITINDASVTTIHVLDYQPDGGEVSFDLAFGANDEIFVFGTLRVVEAVLNGDPGLDTSDVYQRGSEYILPNASSVFYGDSDLLTSFIGLYGFALVGPSIGYWYSAADPVFLPTPVPFPTPTPLIATVAPESTAELATPTHTPTLTDVPASTEVPTEDVTQEPTQEPTEEPTEEPAGEPTEEPTPEATEEALHGGTFMMVSNERQMDDPTEYILSLIEHLHAVLDVGVISQATTEDGAIVSRAVLVLNPQ